MIGMTEPPRRRRGGQPRPRGREQLGQAVIGTREIYDLLIEVRDTVTDLDAGQRGQAAEIADLKRDVAALSTQVKALEKWRYMVVGAAAAAAGALGKLAGII